MQLTDSVAGCWQFVTSITDACCCPSLYHRQHWAVADGGGGGIHPHCCRVLMG